MSAALLRRRLRLTMAALVVALALTPRAAAAQILGSIDSPTINQSVPQPFLISGWMAMTGQATGIDVVHVYGCPVSNCGTPTFWGAATYGIARPDVAAAYGTNNYLYSGFSFLMSGLTPNTAYITKVYAHAWQTNVWYEFTMGFTATATPYHSLETPTQNGLATQPFATSGWAIDAAAPTGTGVDAVDVWVYPNLGTGAPPSYVGGATYGTSRPDVAAAYGARFQPSGYTKTLNGQPAGIYWYEVGAHSTATGAWTIRTVAAYVDLPTADLTITRGGTGTGAITATGLSCPGGANTQAVPCSANYPFGTGVTLTAVPDAGSVFTGWTGVCTGTGVCGIGINAPKYVAATFTKIPTSYTVSYYHTDVIGSVRAVTDAAGTEVVRHDYKPFGEDPVPLSNDPQPFRFAGKEVDLETALHYFEARYYGQTWGRFTQVDPVSGWASDPQSFNRYAYARNNPLKYVDPTGLAYRVNITSRLEGGGLGWKQTPTFFEWDDDFWAWIGTKVNWTVYGGYWGGGIYRDGALIGDYEWYPSKSGPPEWDPPTGPREPPGGPDDPPGQTCPSCGPTPPAPPGPPAPPPGCEEMGTCSPPPCQQTGTCKTPDPEPFIVQVAKRVTRVDRPCTMPFSDRYWSVVRFNQNAILGLPAKAMGVPVGKAIGQAWGVAGYMEAVAWGVSQRSVQALGVSLTAAAATGAVAGILVGVVADVGIHAGSLIDAAVFHPCSG